MDRNGARHAAGTGRKGIQAGASEQGAQACNTPITDVMAWLDHAEERARAGTGPACARVAVTDLNGLLREQYLGIPKLRGALEQGFQFCGAIFQFDFDDHSGAQRSETQASARFGDLTVRLDPATLRIAHWDGDVPFLLGSCFQTDGAPHPYCSRQVLQRVLARVEKAGFQAHCGIEYEWINFAESGDAWQDASGARPKPVESRRTGYAMPHAPALRDFARKIAEDMTGFRVPIDSLHSELEAGAYEVALSYTDALAMADQAVFFKSGVKEIARDFGIMPSFMAKWHDDMPGNGGHIHQSLSQGDRPAFYDARRPHGMSTVFEHYLAGQLCYLREMSPMYWPNVNSYKRLVDIDSAPVTTNWSVDDRRASLRVVGADRQSVHLENRCPGADANPYLAMAAMIASGVAGIEQRLSLQDVTVALEAHPAQARHPRTLDVAADAMRDSAVARDWLGDAFVSHYCDTRLWESEAGRHAVTDWDRKRYLAIV